MGLSLGSGVAGVSHGLGDSGQSAVLPCPAHCCNVPSEFTCGLLIWSMSLNPKRGCSCVLDRNLYETCDARYRALRVALSLEH